MPDERSVRRWARNHGEFGDQYAIVRRLGYKKRADELLEIADNASADWIETENGHRILDNVHVNRARLMIDTRKWLLSKMLPKVYGDHLTVAGDPDQPIRVVQRINWTSLSDEELEAIEAFALAAQRRLNAAPKVEEQMTLENCALIPQG
jgi:Bacteriophage Sf6, terminase small subunit-like